MTPAGGTRMAKVVAISENRSLSREIADLAYSFWIARSFRNGSPEEDLRRAVKAVEADNFERPRRLFLVQRVNFRGTSAGG
jgi:hypothetical protein